MSSLPYLGIKRIKAIEELREEVKDRRKRWTMADSKENRFLKTEHQNRFDILIQLGCVLSTMTDREYIDLVKRHQHHQKEKAEIAANNLFENKEEA